MRPDQTVARVIVHLRIRIEEGILEGLQVLAAAAYDDSSDSRRDQHHERNQ